MKQQFDLNELERQVYRSNFQDGLWDIFLGLLLFQSVIGTTLYRQGWSPAMSLLVILGYVVLVIVGFKYLKKYVVTPRLGLVTYGSERQAKHKKLTLVLSLSVLVGVIMFLIGVGAYQQALSGVLPRWLPVSMLPLGVFTIVSVIVFSVAAYLTEFTRAYVYGWFFGLTMPLNVLIWETSNITFPVVTALFSTIMVLIGLVLFVRFLQTHPLVDMEV